MSVASGRSMPIGVLIIGDEILSGRRKDTHLAAVIERLAPRGRQPDWAQMIGDDADRIESTLRDSRRTGSIVFCFGGIGATPDDLTRASAARAFERPLTRHPEAERRIIAQFGEAAFPHRVHMADFPDQVDLIPNPVNNVAGFYLENHFFMPGFPQMAHPMLDWILAHPLASLGTLDYREQSLWTIGASESDLLPTMTGLCAEFPNLKFFSLPIGQGERRLIELGFKGASERVAHAMKALQNQLDALDVTHQSERPPTESAQT
ncbi:competence/damage-inducible protein A [Halothiobacillus sp.]|uniref:competence/damage-inducible protein A n=1 Tax=Halothiobacillus sp. TaxID=1891311 RepID=UPI0026266551|nr:competence/damage-inducible protein A [Halothiobacillus sp.]